MTKFNQFRSGVWRTALFAVCLSVCFSSCKDESVKSVQYDPSRPVTLGSFQPLEGGVLTKMLLDGDNFGSDPSKIKVYFNHLPAIVVSSNGSRIYALAPRLPGDTCVVSVVVGNDSLCYENKFLYRSVARVATIAGNGEYIFQGGTLAESKVYARYLSVDNEGNIYASIRDNWYFGFARINESENLVDPLVMEDNHLTARWPTILNPNGSFVDPVTQIVYVAAETAGLNGYVTFDPREGWLMRVHRFQMDPALTALLTASTSLVNALAFCNYDSCLYMRYTSGPLIKVHMDSQESELVYETPAGAGHYGMAFHPLKKNLLYFSFMGNVPGHRQGISVLDVSNPKSGLEKLNKTENAGHRDGKIEQAMFANPWQICFDSRGNLYVADKNNHCIRMVSAEDNTVSTVLGRPGVAGMEDGGRETALFNGPSGIGVSGDGTIYVSDYNNARIRKLVVE
jgi:DNA-binding beta-propeller fold protein YncE